MDAAICLGLEGWGPLFWYMGEERVVLAMPEARNFHGCIGRGRLEALSSG